VNRKEGGYGKPEQAIGSSRLISCGRGTLGRPYIANAAATTAEVWRAQGFVPEEDAAIKKVVADYEKASGNTIDLTITPFAPQRQKIVAAVQSGIVPDLFPNNPGENTALYAWDDKLIDVSDVVETQKEEYTEKPRCLTLFATTGSPRTAAFTACLIRPERCRTMSGGRWSRRPAKMEDVPKTWDAYYSFFKDVQKNLRKQGVRNVYGLGLNDQRGRPQ
jgi:multiple sugar transport system substrate-binding protein